MIGKDVARDYDGRGRITAAFFAPWAVAPHSRLEQRVGSELGFPTAAHLVAHEELMGHIGLPQLLFIFVAVVIIWDGLRSRKE